MTMTLISTVTLAATSKTITFSSIPQTATDLCLLWASRETDNGADYITKISINGTLAGTSRILQGNGQSASSTTYTAWALGSTAQNETANTFSNGSLYIPNYSQSGTNKSFSADYVAATNDTYGYLHTIAGIWTGTAAVDSITLTAWTNGYAAGTTASLYAITKGSGGATVS